MNFYKFSREFDTFFLKYFTVEASSLFFLSNFILIFVAILGYMT